ncbi:hypothetical protein AGMMS49546_10330 [Spirochaetia bacterium]|nr:hypothetical protein AGMMS49546_10330 [Spirochaetia bacterium]
MKKNVLWMLTGLALVLALGGCPNPTGDAPELSGTITISPSESVTTGTPLTATYTGGENVTYQWNKGETGCQWSCGVCVGWQQRQIPRHHRRNWGRPG